MTEQRRLAAILVADVVGYSRLIGQDEAGTLASLAALRSEIIEPAIARHAGRLFKAVGDGFLIEFASAVQAVTAARAIQEFNASGPLPLRIGIHVGDVVVQGDDLMGDGVNIAARIEGVADVGGIAISRAVHEQVRDKLNVSFVDRGEVALKNLARPIQVFALGGATSTSIVEPAPALALPDKPSIAVLPFQNMSGDPEQEYFADGMVEDIITALSRFKSLFVIARNSTFTYKGRPVDIKQVGRELGVRYVLEGSVRKAANRVRITGQLIDSQNGGHLWADRFDGALEDVFEVQDRITTSVVGAIAPKLDQAEIERARRKPVESLDAYDLYLRGMASFYEGTKDGDDESLRLFYRAIERDPGFAPAYGMAAAGYTMRRNKGRVEDKDREVAEARRLATRAAAIGGDDADTLCAAGMALIYVCGDYETGSALIDRAIAINPNSAKARRLRGWASIFLGQHEAALEAFSHFIRLSPLDPQIGEAERGMAAALTYLGRYDEASDWARRVFATQPDVLATMRVAAFAHALAGNIEEARKVAARLCQRDPALRASRIGDYVPHRRPEDIELFAEGLRRAGVPE